MAPSSHASSLRRIRSRSLSTIATPARRRDAHVDLLVGLGQRVAADRDRERRRAGAGRERQPERRERDVVDAGRRAAVGARRVEPSHDHGRVVPDVHGHRGDRRPRQLDRHLVLRAAGVGLAQLGVRQQREPRRQEARRPQRVVVAQHDVDVVVRDLDAVGPEMRRLMFSSPSSSTSPSSVTGKRAICWPGAHSSRNCVIGDIVDARGRGAVRPRRVAAAHDDRRVVVDDHRHRDRVRVRPVERDVHHQRAEPASPSEICRFGSRRRRRGRGVSRSGRDRGRHGEQAEAKEPCMAHDRSSLDRVVLASEPTGEGLAFLTIQNIDGSHVTSRVASSAASSNSPT